MKRSVEYTVEVLLDEEDAKELKVQENVILEILQEAVPDGDVKITGRRIVDDEDEATTEDDDDEHYQRGSD